MNARKRDRDCSGKDSEEVSCRESHRLLEGNRVAVNRHKNSEDHSEKGSEGIFHIPVHKSSVIYAHAKWIQLYYGHPFQKQQSEFWCIHVVIPLKCEEFKGRMDKASFASFKVFPGEP